MSKRCYVMLYNSSSLFVPIKSKKIGSAYGGMPQFFGGGALKQENNLESISRELNEEGLGYLNFKKKPKLNIIHKKNLNKHNKKINFYFYMTNDFTYHVKSMCFTLPEIGEISRIVKFKFIDDKKNNTYSMCEKLGIKPSDHFQKSETFAAFNLILKKLTNNITTN